MTETPRHVALKIEGALVAEWVLLLERECVYHLNERKHVELDFRDVSFVDGEGVAVVRRLVVGGVTVLHATPLVQDLLRGRGE